MSSPVPSHLSQLLDYLHGQCDPKVESIIRDRLADPDSEETAVVNELRSMPKLSLDDFAAMGDVLDARTSFTTGGMAPADHAVDDRGGSDVADSGDRTVGQQKAAIVSAPTLPEPTPAAPAPVATMGPAVSGAIAGGFIGAAGATAVVSGIVGVAAAPVVVPVAMVVGAGALIGGLLGKLFGSSDK
jgi:hypothetical protein